MKRISVRVIAALLAFVVGVTATALWSFYVRFQSRQLDDTLSDSIISPVNIEVSEESAVYSRVLSDERYVNDCVKAVNIVDQTSGYPSAADDERFSLIDGYIKERIPELSQATLSNYLSQNRESRHLENHFNLKVKTVLINQKEVESIFKEHSMDGLGIIFERYPGSRGLITLSAVGFNPDMTQALVHVALSCGALCGEGNLFLLRKDNGVWKIQKKIATWVS
jgi:hypothetical protein